MKREEMIREMTKLPVRAVPVVYTDDIGIVYDYIVPEGAGQGMGAFVQWPVLHLKGVEQSQWDMIRQKIEEEMLRPEDLTGSSLEVLADWMKNCNPRYYEELSESFSELTELSEISPEVLYCLFDVSGGYDEPRFFDDEEIFMEEFRSSYCNAPCTWETLEDDEIEEWYNRINEELDGVPFCKLGFD